MTLKHHEVKTWTHSREGYDCKMSTIAQGFLAKRILSSPRHLSSAAYLIFPTSRFSLTSTTNGPTFSSTGNPKNLVTKLGVGRLFNVLWNGKLHSPMPQKYNLVPKEFISVALEAVALVTRAASEKDWEGLDGLVHQHCISGLRDQVESMSEGERKQIVLHPEDAFLSFISNEKKSSGGKDVNLVVFFYPDLYKVKETAEEMNQLKKETDEKIKKNIFEGNIKNTSDLKDEFVDFKEKLKELNAERSDLFNKHGASWCGMVGNYRLVRESLDGQWAVSELGQVDSARVMTPIVRWAIGHSLDCRLETRNLLFLRFRWKALLGKSVLNGTSFQTVLRRDLWIHLFIVLFSLWISIATSMPGASIF